MKRVEKNYEIYEYRTGGTVFPARNHLLLTGVFVLVALVVALLVGAFWLSQSEPLSNQKIIGTLSLPAAPITPDNAHPEDALYMDGEVVACEDIGFNCQAISEFCERLYSLPSGIYIVSVQQNTHAAGLGVLPGDILISINGEPLRAPATLQHFLSECPENSHIALEFYRKEKTFTVNFAPGG